MTILYLIQSPVQVASSRTRAYAYLPFLRAADLTCRVLVWNSDRFVKAAGRGPVPVGVHVLNLLHRLSVALRMLWQVRGCEAVYIQKVVLPAWMMRWLGRGRRIVFDYDDALYALGPEQDRGWRAGVRRWRTKRFTACLQACDLVILENEPNRQWTAKHCPQTLIITGPIDTERYRPRRQSNANDVVLGWIGSPSTTGYLRMLDPVFERLAARGHRFVVHLIGASPFSSGSVEVRQSAWSLDGEVEALETFDVGLMPLSDDPWARGKGGYKILQYMAMGIPTVASPVGINADMVEHGVTGYLAESADEWVDALERLLGDAEVRRRCGAAARARALASYSLEHYAPMFASALTSEAARKAAAADTLPAEGMTR